jgi:hypothetical protein
MGSVLIHIFAIAALMIQTNPNDRVIGKWKTVEGNYGFHLIIEFTGGGSYSQTMVMEDTGWYEDKEGIIYFTEMAAEPSRFRIEGDKVVMRTPKREERFERLDKVTPNAPPIVGRWGLKSAFENGQKYSMVVEFTKDGRTTSYIEFEPERGSYTIKGDLLTISFGSGSETRKYRIEERFLIIEPAITGSDEEKYTRIK